MRTLMTTIAATLFLATPLTFAADNAADRYLIESGKLAQTVDATRVVDVEKEFVDNRMDRYLTTRGLLTLDAKAIDRVRVEGDETYDPVL